MSYKKTSRQYGSSAQGSAKTTGKPTTGKHSTGKPSTGIPLFAQRPLRRSALISPWGVGAMVDFPHDESLMTCGLDAWEFSRNRTLDCPSDFQFTEERLQQRLGVSGFRLPPDFRKPGQGGDNNLRQLGVPFVRFPRWHFCPHCGNMRKLGLFSGAQRCDAPPWLDGRSCTGKPERKRPRLVPARFVAVCGKSSHIQDFPFMQWVHREQPPTSECRLRLRSGLGVSLPGMRLECTCGQKASLGGIFNDRILDNLDVLCCGCRPWLGEVEEKAPGCGESLRVVQRGASNVYFAHVASSIYLPLWGENSRRPVVEALENNDIWEPLTSGLMDGKIDLARCQAFLQFNTSARWRGLTAEELQEAAQKKLDDQNKPRVATTQLSPHEEEEKYRYDEYEAMCVGHTVQPSLEMELCQGGDYDEPIAGFFRTVTLLKKLRETRAFYGFSRCLPDDGRSPSEQIEQLRLDSSITWLPAIMTHGEGIFFEVDAAKIELWLQEETAQKRVGKLLENHRRARVQRGQPPRPVSPKFVMLHTLAHLIINQLSFDCGYGSSSLRERIYCDASFADKPMQGFLIYTASGDAEGTMGGLVRQGSPGRIEATLLRALQRACWCSYDPICMESQGQGPDSCNRAACHGCAILPETSCEEGNRLLDRGLVVGVPDAPITGFFGSLMAEKIVGNCV